MVIQPAEIDLQLSTTSEIQHTRFWALSRLVGLVKANLESPRALVRQRNKSRIQDQLLDVGKTINWKTMVPVTVPYEFSQAVKVETSDIELLPSTASGFREELSDKIGEAERGLSLPERPSPC